MITDARGLPLVPVVTACHGPKGEPELVLTLVHDDLMPPDVTAADLLLASGYTEPFVHFGPDGLSPYLNREVLRSVRRLPKRHPGRHALLRDAEKKGGACWATPRRAY